MRRDRFRDWSRWGVPLAIGVMLVQGGCLSGPAPPDRFYRLEIAEPSVRFEPPRLQGRLLVDRFRGDAMTLERSMLYRSADEPFQVRREGYDQWVDPPPDLVQRAVVEFLRSANAASEVITPDMRLDADFRLAGRLNRFERLLGQGAPRAAIELEFALVRLEDRELLLLETYREEEPADGDGIGSSVDAFGRALHRIFERLALDLPER